MKMDMDDVFSNSDSPEIRPLSLRVPNARTRAGSQDSDRQMKKALEASMKSKEEEDKKDKWLEQQFLQQQVKEENDAAALLEEDLAGVVGISEAGATADDGDNFVPATPSPQRGAKSGFGGRRSNEDVEPYGNRLANRFMDISRKQRAEVNDNHNQLTRAWCDAHPKIDPIDLFVSYPMGSAVGTNEVGEKFSGQRGFYLSKFFINPNFSFDESRRDSRGTYGRTATSARTVSEDSTSGSWVSNGTASSSRRQTVAKAESCEPPTPKGTTWAEKSRMKPQSEPLTANQHHHTATTDTTTTQSQGAQLTGDGAAPIEELNEEQKQMMKLYEEEGWPPERIRELIASGQLTLGARAPAFDDPSEFPELNAAASAPTSKKTMAGGGKRKNTKGSVTDKKSNDDAECGKDGATKKVEADGDHPKQRPTTRGGAKGKGSRKETNESSDLYDQAFPRDNHT